MNSWIEQHPYMFMFLMIYSITTLNHIAVKIAERKSKCGIVSDK